MQRLQPNFTTDGIRNFMAQQKQRKQPILIDGKNIFTHCFQSIQRLQSNCKTYAIRNFMHTKHNGDNRKLRIFSFLPEPRRIQPDFMNHTYQTTNRANTTQTTKITTSTWVSPLTQSLCSYNWDNENSGVFIFKFQPISKNSHSTNFVHFIHRKFVHFISLEKPVRGLMNNFVHFIHPYMNPLPKMLLTYYCNTQKQSSVELAKFVWKQLCRSLFFSKVAGRSKQRFGHSFF